MPVAATPRGCASKVLARVCRQNARGCSTLRAELEQRRAKRRAEPEVRENIPESDAELHEWRRAGEEQVYMQAERMNLFAYPKDRSVPWVTLGVLGLTVSVTAYYKRYWTWVHSARSREDIEERVDEFIAALDFAKNNLVVASFLRMEAPASSALHMISFFFASTLVERIYGPLRLAALLGASTLAGNAAASVVEAPVSTSPAVLAVSTLAFLRFRRWAIWPGVPIPQFWFFAPLMVCQILTLRRFYYTREVEEDRDATRQMHIIPAMDLCTQNSFERMEPAPDFGPIAEEIELTPQRDSTVLSNATGLLIGAAAAALF